MSGADADWLRLALRRTEEARQRWRLRCVAAEAGLQALQALQAPSAGGPADEDELEVQVALSQVEALEEHQDRGELEAWERRIQSEASAAQQEVAAARAARPAGP
ncbi:unnamed protein product, partial [Prorocentrum cordatum]